MHVTAHYTKAVVIGKTLTVYIVVELQGQEVYMHGVLSETEVRRSSDD